MLSAKEVSHLKKAKFSNKPMLWGS